MFQLRTIAKRVEGIEALDRPAEQVGKLLEPYLTKRPLKDILSGTWIGHPLHPVLTDVVIGSWISAGFLDLFPTKQSSRAADKLILLGCVSALPTALAGASDWLDVGGRERRVGLVHALGNITAIVLYLWSYLSRKRGKRFKGLALSTLGGAVSVGSAFLGGHLSFGMGVGVHPRAITTRTSRRTGPRSSTNPRWRASARGRAPPVPRRTACRSSCTGTVIGCSRCRTGAAIEAARCTRGE